MQYNYRTINLLSMGMLKPNRQTCTLRSWNNRSLVLILATVRTVPLRGGHPRRSTNVPANPPMRNMCRPMHGQEHTPIMDQNERVEILARRAGATKMVLEETQLWQVLTR